MSSGTPYKTLEAILLEELAGTKVSRFVIHHLERRLGEEIAVRLASAFAEFEVVQTESLGRGEGSYSASAMGAAGMRGVLKASFGQFLGLPDGELGRSPEYDQVPPTVAPAPVSPLTEQDP